MIAPPDHPEARLDAWLDGRLDATERRELEEHLASCARCRDQLAALEAVRSAVRDGLEQPPPPPGLEVRILDRLDREDAERRPPTAAAPRWPAAGRWLPIAAALAVATLLFFLLRGAPEPEPADLVAAATRAHAELGASLPEGLAVADAAAVEARWRAGGVDFPARVLDLGAMGIALAGGDVAALDGRAAARTVYRGDGGWLVCLMFRGAVDALPAADEVRARDGFRFHVFRRDGRTLVFWQEGAVVCALVGEGDSETVLGLAVAKAMAPAPRA